MKWERIGKILEADSSRWWFATHSGPTCVLPKDGNLFEVFITGRDSKNRSHIGTFELNLDRPDPVSSLSEEPVFSVGEKGCFDENGVSYPYIVRAGSDYFMYYVGWMPTVLTPFQNHIGLARSTDKKSWTRVSKAPILERTHEEPFCLGSSYVLNEGGIFKMWYTSFLRWGDPEKKEHKHYYVIKKAESPDGIHWERDNKICIPIQSDDEYSIGRPSVLKIGGTYHMWYCYRGEHYKIGYATSENGADWIRKDSIHGLDPTGTDWEGISVSYPTVFQHGDHLYMLYCGNDFGRAGLGLARMKGI